VDKSNFKNRRGAGLISGLTLLLASAMPLAVTAADEAAAKQLEIVQKGIPHDAIFGINIVGKNGYASGGAGYILETKDGGSTWAKTESGTQVSLLGIGIGGDHRIVVGQQGTVLLQKDGKWVAGKSGSDKRLLNVDVNAAGLAVAVGEFGTILRSKDGGATWEPKVLDWASYRDDGYEPHIYSVDVQDNGRIVLGAEFSYVLVSEDGGETFTLTNKGEKSIFAMHLLADGTGYAAGQEGLIMKTSDNGSTWTALNSGSNANLFGLWASAQGEIVATGMRALLRSSDGGSTFTASTDQEVVRNWYVPVAMGEVETKSDAGALVQQVVYVGGHDGVIARVLR